MGELGESVEGEERGDVVVQVSGRGGAGRGRGEAVGRQPMRRRRREEEEGQLRRCRRVVVGEGVKKEAVVAGGSWRFVQ